MNARISFFLLPFLLLPFLSREEAQEAKPKSEPPNIILIVADDLGLYDLGCYGNDIIETPRIDSLAANGIRFTKAYAATPICSPSRAAIVTGLHPARMSLTEHIRGFPPPDPCWPVLPPRSMQRLPLAYTTIAEVLKENDYQTSYIGKWHLGGGAYAPPAHGYDVSYAAGGQGLPSSFFPPYFNGNPFPELFSIAGGDDYLTDALGTLAIHALPETQESPFFMHLNFYSPHVPIEGKPELVEKYEDIIGDDPDALPRPQYAAMVESIDQQVGRLVDTLEARGMLDNTIILFSSDHGALTVEEVPAFSAHTPPTDSGPLRAGKGYLYEGGVRIPLIVYAPVRYTAAIEDYPVMNTDFFSTLTHLGESPQSSLDGLPIPALTGAPEVERSLYFHYPHFSPQGGWPGGVVLNGEYKLIQRYSDVDSVRLYNLAADPGEQLDQSELDPTKVQELQELLEEWKSYSGARPMKPNPDYVVEDCN